MAELLGTARFRRSHLKCKWSPLSGLGLKRRPLIRKAAVVLPQGIGRNFLYTPSDCTAEMCTAGKGKGSFWLLGTSPSCLPRAVHAQPAENDCTAAISFNGAYAGEAPADHVLVLLPHVAISSRENSLQGLAGAGPDTVSMANLIYGFDAILNDF